MCLARGEPGGPRRCSGDARAGYERAAADLAAVTPCSGFGGPEARIEPVKWFSSTRPSDPVLEGLAAEVVMVTRPPGVLSGIPKGDPTRLAEWFESELELSDFDRISDHAAVHEHASLLLEVEGWDLTRYLSCDGGLLRVRMRGAQLYGMAFGLAAARRGIRRIPVYRALYAPMTPERGLRCASWNPQAHIAEAEYRYQAWVQPSDVVGISVNVELHPIIAVSRDLGWRRVRLSKGARGEF